MNKPFLEIPTIIDVGHTSYRSTSVQPVLDLARNRLKADPSALPGPEPAATQTFGQTEPAPITTIQTPAPRIPPPTPVKPLIKLPEATVVKLSPAPVTPAISATTPKVPATAEPQAVEPQDVEPQECDLPCPEDMAAQSDTEVTKEVVPVTEENTLDEGSDTMIKEQIDEFVGSLVNSITSFFTPTPNTDVVTNEVKEDSTMNKEENTAAASEAPAVELIAPVVAQEPTVVEATVETPVAATEAPAIIEVPVVVEIAAIVEAPVVVEAPAVVEASVVVEAPAVVEATVETPAAVVEATVETPAAVVEATVETPAVIVEAPAVTAAVEPVVVQPLIAADVVTFESDPQAIHLSVADVLEQPSLNFDTLPPVNAVEAIALDASPVVFVAPVVPEHHIAAEI